jgi:cation transport ATPase
MASTPPAPISSQTQTGSPSDSADSVEVLRCVDEVFAGTLNGTGALRVRVGRRAEESVVARIAALVDQAVQTKARRQLFIEKIEQRYSVGMVVATITLFMVPLLWGEPPQESLLRAMTFMIVASPCAVVLATMPPLLAAIANAGRHGVLVKSAVVLKQLGATTRVAFDKDGDAHLRHPGAGRRPCPAGRPASARTNCCGWPRPPSAPANTPLAAAVVLAARRCGLPLGEADEFTAQPGRGVTARIDDHVVQVGSPDALLDGDDRSTDDGDHRAGAWAGGSPLGL